MSPKRILFTLLINTLFCNLLISQSLSFFNKFEKEAELKPDSVLRLLESQNYSDQLSNEEFIYLKAFCFEELGNYPKVDSIFENVFNSLDFSEDSSLLLKFYIVLADQRKITDRFEEASTYLHKAIKLGENLNDTLNLANTYISLGELYRATEYFSLGLKNLERAEYLLKDFNKKESEKVLARLYGRRSAIFLQSKIHLDSIEVLSLKCLFIGRKIGDIDLQATSLNELGHLYTNLNNKKAEAYLNQAINLWESAGYAAYSSNARLNLARYYHKEKKYNEGINILLKNLSIIEDSPWRWFRGEYYDMLGQLYSSLEEYKQAYEYAVKAKDTLILVTEIQYNEQLALFSTQLEVQKKEEELYRQKTEIEKAKLQAITQEEENKMLYYVIVTILLIALITLSFLYFINQKNNRLKSQKIENERINEELANLVDQKQALLREVNHRVKNNLSVLSSLLYLQQKKLTNKEAIQALKSTLVRINTISLIHESLYNRDDMEKVNFQDYLIKLTGYIKSIYWQEGKELTISIECDDFKPELSFSVPLAMIINELITNSFKYAFKKIAHPEIKIECTGNSLYYCDNGPGIVSEKKEDSLGLNLIEVFAQQIGAKIVANKTENHFIYTIYLKS